jgi:hypothetical protein
MTEVTAHPPARRWSPGRTASVVAGSLVALIAIGLLAAGGGLLWGNAQKDDQGYISTGSHRFATSTYAVATENLDVNVDGASWLVSKTDHFGKIRLKVASQTGKPAFVGIARTSDVSAYLHGVAHATITDVDYSPFKASYRDEVGAGRPVAPAGRHIWAASTHGAGPQTLSWDVKSGSWSIVVMNADGSPGVAAGVKVGANVPFLGTLGWISLGAGLVLLAGAGGLMALGFRKPHTRPPGPEAVRPVPAAV